MEIEVKTRDDVSIVRLAGRLVIGDAPDALRETVDDLLAEGGRKIVLDVSGLARIDSSGIGELVAALKRTRGAGGRLVLMQPVESVRRILDLSHVLPLFEAHDDEDSAVAALGD